MSKYHCFIGILISLMEEFTLFFSHDQLMQIFQMYRKCLKSLGATSCDMKQGSHKGPKNIRCQGTSLTWDMCSSGLIRLFTTQLFSLATYSRNAFTWHSLSPERPYCSHLLLVLMRTSGEKHL